MDINEFFDKAIKLIDEENYEEAVKWYRLVADQGNVQAKYNLGYCFLEGKGVEQSYEEAKKIFHYLWILEYDVYEELKICNNALSQE